MDKNRAAHQARLLIAAHGLDPDLFTWNRGKNLMGQMRATYNRTTGEIVLQSISLSSYWVEAMTEDEVREVTLHEIAHAFHPRDGHGWKFRAKVREIGGTATDRCFSASAETKARMAEIAPPAWQGICSQGHKSKAMHRAPARVRTCGKCSSRWDIRNVFTWRKNGRLMTLEEMPTSYQREYHRANTSRLLAAIKSG